jgi:PAS domain S-box-containing protein
MGARVTEAVQAKITLPQHAGPRAVATERARQAFFSSVSRELRWSLDREERFLVLDGAWESVLGWRPERLHGWHWTEIVHPADRGRVERALEQARAVSGGDCDVELRVAVATGGYRRMAWAFCVGYGAESVLGLGHARDESGPAGGDLARQLSELEALNQELEQRLAAMAGFAGTAAHQLAEPLIITESSAILVADELGEELDPELRDRLDAISRCAARARRLMHALLEDARASTESLELGRVAVGDVVADSTAAFRPRIEQHRAVVEAGPLPAVLADAGLLAVVLDNLLSNALKHGPRDGNLIRVSAAPDAEGWRIAVESGGPPIPAAAARRILKPYVRLPGERRISGSGLGLAICVRLVERMGGTLGVDPGRDEGNTFWFVLPAAPR